MAKRSEAELMFEQLLKEAAKPDSAGVDLPSQMISPQPGFCMKTVKIPDGTDPWLNRDGWPPGAEKVFLNICFSEKLPDPPDISEEKLVELIQVSEDAEGAEGFRVPMSLGEPHAELDKSGKGCTVYDVVISQGFMKKIKEKEVFMSFFMTVALEGLEDKYKINLSRDCKLLKNKKFMGTLPEHNVRTKSKPQIQEVRKLMEELKVKDGQKQLPEFQKIEEVEESKKSAAKEPKFVIFKDPPDENPEFLVVEIQLPGVISAKSLQLDVNEDTLLLTTRSDLYRLHVKYLPFDVIPEQTLAQFNKQTSCLTVTLTISSSSKAY